MLTPNDLAKLATDLLPAAQALAAQVESGMDALNKHAAERGAPAINPGPFSVARNLANELVTQLAKHERENTPPSPAKP